MSRLKEISPDPKKPLSADEFKRAWRTFYEHHSETFTDEAIQAALPTIPQEEFDDAVRWVKFAAYKKLFWDKLSGLDLDP